MKFYDIVYADSGFDLSQFGKFIYKSKPSNGYIIIKFNSSEINEVASLYRKAFKLIDTHSEMLENLCFFASDGFIYKDDGECLINTKQFGIFKFLRILSVVKSRIRKINKAKKITEKIKIKSLKSDIIEKFSFSSYKPYVYYDKDTEIAFKFRLKRSESDNQPLVVFMAGGGCHGYDNFKPMYEYYTHIHRQLKKYDCSVLIPQSPCSSNFIKPTFSDYIEAVKNLSELVVKDVNADEKRIYLIGTSYGGCCTWNMIYNSPDYFACGIPVMGTLLGGVNLAEADFERFRTTPLWIAHSADDDNVPIKSDDFCYGELKKIGIDVKYTRWDKYGHKMCNKFYKSEPWAEWMFEQNR